MDKKNELKQKCLTLIQYIYSKGGGELVMDIKPIVENAYKKNKTKDLERVLKDLTEWVSGLIDGEEETTIDSILEGELRSEENRVRDFLLGTQKITSLEEYRIVEDYVNKNWEQLRQKGTLLQVNEMLSSWNQEE